MLPIILMSLRHGPKACSRPLCTALIQLFLGLKTSPTARRWARKLAACCWIMLAFTVLGLAWYIARPFPSSKVGRVVGAGVSTFVVCALRYVCSVLSGYVVWKDYDYAFDWMTNFGWGQAIEGMAENALCWLYSIVYNATYMIPEALFTVAAAVVLMLAAPKLFDARAKL
ncbi:MAG: energy-coupled thiamine transporter ThiT [Ruthenibacterium sp.]